MQCTGSERNACTPCWGLEEDAIMLDMPTTSVVSWPSGTRATCTCHSGPQKTIKLLIITRKDGF